MNVSLNYALKYLDCASNQLTSLDLSMNPELDGLDCKNNQLTSLNLSGKPKLDDLLCYGNRITTLDVSDCPVLQYLVEHTERRTEHPSQNEANDVWYGDTPYGYGYLAVDSYTTVIAGNTTSAATDNLPTEPEEPEEQKVKYKNGVYKIKDGKATLIGVTKSIKTLTIPAKVKGAKVTAIAAGACKGLAKLTKVTIGKNVQKIGKNAFKDCKKLKKIIIQTTKLTKSSVGAKAFDGIYKKATVKCPNKETKTAYSKWLYKRGLPAKAKVK